jgi:glycosyltransferase involved in cell wall biosynthesis
LTSVAFLVDQVFFRVPGGIGTYVRRLVPALARADPSLDLTLFHARFDRSGPEPWMEGFRVVALPWSVRRLYLSWTALRRPPLPDPIARAAVVHSPTPVAAPPVRPGQRLVVTVHDLAFLVHPELFTARWRLLHRAGLLRAVRAAHAVVVPSRHTARDLLRRTRLDSARLHVVPLAASPPRPRPQAELEEALARLKVPRPYLLSVGTLEPRKNLVRLVRAYRRVAPRLPHALVLAGPMGWRPQPLLRAVAEGGAGRVVLTGAVSEGDLDALYRGAQAFAYPSVYEGFGLPVLEAMARGVPCVVSTSSSLPEVAGEAALLVDPRSVAGLAEALERVLTDRDLADRLREAGLARAAQFSWEETARRTLDVYRSLG